MNDRKVLAAMSGGVDSSVTAQILTEQGYECIGCTMRLYDYEDAVCSDKTCCSLDDVEDARSVARRLGIPYHVFNFTDDFREQIIGKFARCYAAGLTPNPCIDCNRYMKFAKLLDRAKVLGCRFIATGHYARIEETDSGFILRKGLDAGKDQSYVLYMLTQEQLACTLLPLGGLTKSQVREIAAAHGFVNARKRDSQDICFVPDGDYAKVVEHHLGRSLAPGNFVDRQGRVLGRHKGIIHYTVGQHRGLGLTLPQAHYVCALRPESNEVVLGPAAELFRRETDILDCNWISGRIPEAPVRCQVKVRYRASEQWAAVTATGETTAHVCFDEAQRAVAPGQAAVFYDGDTVLGGGVIAPRTS